MSAYLNEEVVLEMSKFSQGTGTNTFDREINLLARGRVFCNAQSKLVVSSTHIFSLLSENGLGLGQLFAKLGLLPSFHLRSYGKTTEILYRTYVLQIEGLQCTITEVFPATLFTSDYDSATENFTKEIWQKMPLDSC